MRFRIRLWEMQSSSATLIGAIRRPSYVYIVIEYRRSTGTHCQRARQNARYRVTREATAAQAAGRVHQYRL